jgi:hypothetical protein
LGSSDDGQQLNQELVKRPAGLFARDEQRAGE